MGSDSLDPWAIDAGWGEVVDGHADKLERLLTALQSQAAAIREDRNLSQSGKGEAIASAGDATRAAIAEVGIPAKLANELGKVDRELPATLALPPEPADPEQRNPLGPPDRLLGLVLNKLLAIDPGDALALRGAIMGAARAGDPLPIIACQNAPRFILSVEPKVVEEAVEAYHEAVNGEAVKRRTLLGRVRGRIETNLQLARQQTEALAGPGVAPGVSVQPVAV